LGHKRDKVAAVVWFPKRAIERRQLVDTPSIKMSIPVPIPWEQRNLISLGANDHGRARINIAIPVVLFSSPIGALITGHGGSSLVSHVTRKQPKRMLLSDKGVAGGETALG
jgi:hypothetical protein